MIDLHRLRLFASTLRHLTPAQGRARLRMKAGRVMRRVLRKRFAPPRDVRIASHASLWDVVSQRADAENGRRVAAGKFVFLSQELDDPRWNEPRASRLWRYHLHYFDYALDLALIGDYATFERLTQSWMRVNDAFTGDGWHPYPLSLRIVNWLLALDAFGVREGELASSIYGQTRFLAANLEHDVRGNHLLKNIRALIWSGVMFEGDEAQRWLDEGLRLLRIEVAEQVLADGGHFERVPAYHVVVLRDLEETAEFLRRNREAPAWLDDAVARMRDFLDAILGPGDRLPLLKDTTLDVELPSLMTRRTRASELLAASGYAICRGERTFLIADVGAPCPPYLPAHAHADMFSFELTVDGAPLIVDSGVYEYAEGTWRDWFRSTAAHNTLELARTNQSEVWGSFRVARRAQPRNVRWLTPARGEIVQAEHDGYLRLRPPAIHRRTLAHVRDAAIVVVDDVLGTGTIDAISYVHFHPDAPRRELFTNGAIVEETEGWYSEHFGEKRCNRVLALKHSGPMPFRIIYAIALQDGVTFRVDGDAIVIGLRDDDAVANRAAWPRVWERRHGRRAPEAVLHVPRDGEPSLR